MSQVRVKHTVAFSNIVDFKVAGRYNVEIGGKNKSKKQIAGINDAFMVLDNIEVGYDNQIPLWVFGMSY